MEWSRVANAAASIRLRAPQQRSRQPRLLPPPLFSSRSLAAHRKRSSTCLLLSNLFRACSHVNHFLSRHANADTPRSLSRERLCGTPTADHSDRRLGHRGCTINAERGIKLFTFHPISLHPSFSTLWRTAATDARTATAASAMRRDRRHSALRESLAHPPRPLVLSPCLFLSVQNAHRCCLPSCSAGRK